MIELVGQPSASYYNTNIGFSSVSKTGPGMVFTSPYNLYVTSLTFLLNAQTAGTTVKGYINNIASLGDSPLGESEAFAVPEDEFFFITILFTTYVRFSNNSPMLLSCAAETGHGLTRMFRRNLNESGDPWGDSTYFRYNAIPNTRTSDDDLHPFMWVHAFPQKYLPSGLVVGEDDEEIQTYISKFAGQSGITQMPSSDANYSKKLVAIGNDEVWYESSEGTMTELDAANGDIDVTAQLQSASMSGKVFIVNGANKKVADFQNVKITTTDIGANPPDFGTILTGGTSSASMVVDYVTALSGAATIYGKLTTSATFAAETVTGEDDDGNAISFTGTSQVVAPHWYDWNVYGGDTTTYGTIPDGPTLIAKYRGRIVLSGTSQYPHQWYMSRQLNPWDWAYAALDAQSPVAGQNADAAECGDIIVSLIPYKDDYLIFGGVNSIYGLFGDATSGGETVEVDSTTGMFGPNSWCWDKKGNLYFFGTDGLNTIDRKTLTLTNLSQSSIPKLVKDKLLNQSTYRVTLGFDRLRNGITICFTLLADGTNFNYFYDLKSEGFFPESYPSSCAAYSQIFYPAINDDYTDLYIGGADGYLRVFDDTSKNDIDTDGTSIAISSNVLMPIQDLNEEDDDGEGRLISTTMVTAGGASGGAFNDTDGVTLDIHVADDAETLVEDVIDGATPLITKTYTGTGRQKRLRDRARGKWLGMYLKNSTASQTWVLGKLSIKTKIVGRIK